MQTTYNYMHSAYKRSLNREDAKLSIGKGWRSLIDEVYDRLPKEAFVFQVKEKWGMLRMYIDNIPDEIQEFLGNIETRSGKICEVCGEPGQQRDTGWIKTLCDKCFNKAKNDYINIP